MALDRQRFREQFDVFRERVRRKSKAPFVSFHEGLVHEWEGYKEPNRQRALAALDAGSWQKSHAGRGDILRHIVDAIEVPRIGDAEPANNLVAWHEGYGHQSRAHYRLLDARNEPDLRRRIEAWAYAFYREDGEPADAFERLRELAGARYDLIAYMMFLRDSSRFMPIKVQTFDAAFRALDIDLKTDGSCSWENYTRYNAALEEIRAEFAAVSGLGDVRLVDAHSFCWLLVRPEMEPDDERYIASDKGKASNSRKLGAVENSIFEMAQQAAATAASSNGQQVLVTKKNKDLVVPSEELRRKIRELIARQNERCALTGIRLQFKGDHTDPSRLASLDRIDSDKHYEPHNLQVVCRFINGWKSDTPDAEFRRLLQMVRMPAEAV